MSDATQRWKDCRREMLTLMAGAPTVRDSINRLLQAQWQLDGERVVLQFSATQQHGRSQITLTDACLYMQQRPSLDTAQVPEGSVLYLPPNHALMRYSLGLLLDELKTLDLEQAIEDNWLRYWRTERAPKTPVTCLQRATELYRAHFEASGEHVLAEGKVNTEVLDPLFWLINPTQATSDIQKIYIEQLLLKPSAINANAIALPGAWVLTLDVEEPANQLLYLPTRAPAWKCFTHRVYMERWLLEQQPGLFSTAGIDAGATIEYKRNNNPLEAGISLWLKQLVENQYQDAIRSSAEIEIHHAYLARQHIDQLDAQRHSHSLFAQAPELPEPDVDTLSAVNFLQFGQLHNRVGARQRNALMQQQRRALQSLLGSDTPSSPCWQSFKQQLDALKVQQNAAEEAASAMLNRRPLDLVALNTHYSALYHARHQGLQIEARIQRTLNQISEDELHMIETALVTPERDVVALTLSVTLPGNPAPIVTELNGPLVFLPPQDPQTPTTRDGTHFIYWPGNGGALQRFASRQALEEGLFGIDPKDDVVTLRFKVVAKNPFEYSLSSQQTAFDEQAARLRQTWAAPEDASKLAGELEKLREQTLPGLLIPDNSAREAAHLQLIEQHNAALLAEQVPTWLSRQPPAKRDALKALLHDYISAAKRSQALIERSLPPRDVFVRQKLDARLRKDFSIKKGFTLQLELPDSVVQRREFIEGSAMGTPVRLVDVPSKERSKISLDELALRNIGDDISPRLGFVSVEVTADDPHERDTLKVGVTADYLARTVKDLNLAQKYENLIRATFMGAPGESTYQKLYRRECLTEPLRLMLKGQSMLARLQGLRDDDAYLDLLNIAIDANTPAAWEVGGKRIRLLPAHLGAGGKDTNEESTITLSGITFIEERNSGKTLLYLPDAPDERCLRGYASLEQARIALFELCRLDSMVAYVAGRAIKGNVQAHIGRIDQATITGYNAIIGAGLPWPATTSLAAHQVDAHMGRLIEANRNGTRSNADLAQEKHELKTGRLINGIHIALGFVPFIGTAVCIAEAVNSLYEAVAAFRRAEIGHGIDQLASVFESLVYAGMDAAATAATPSAKGSTARLLMISRQLKQLSGTSFWRSLKARQGTTTRHRFAGYQHLETVDAGSLQPVDTGPYRHTLRHTSGEHFILSEGEQFKVRFDPTTHEMRLVAQGKDYAPAIALDHARQWDTYSALHGGRLTGYGGGSRRPRGAGARVPAAVEQQAPSSVAQVNRQRQVAIQEVNRLSMEFDAQLKMTNGQVEILENQYGVPTTETGMAQRTQATKTVDPLLAADIERAKQLYAVNESAAGFQGSHLRQTIATNQSRNAMVASDRYARLALNANRRLHSLLDQLTELKIRMQAMRAFGTEYLNAEKALKQNRLEMFNELKQIEVALKQIDIWFKRITVPSMKPPVVEIALPLQDAFTPHRLETLQAGQLLQTLHGQRQPGRSSWIYQERLLHQAIEKLDRTISAHLELPEANISKAQRNQVLRNTVEVYEQFQLELTTWNARSPDHFDASAVSHMLEIMKKLTARARKGIKKADTKPQAQQTKNLFETEDGQILVGTEKAAQQQSARQFIVTDSEGKTVEVWDQISNSRRYRLNTAQSQARTQPPALPNDLPTIVTEAQARLDAVDGFESKVRTYTTMDPINLEHMLVSEANALEFRANQLQSLSPTHSLIAPLRNRATPLKTAGQALRIERTLSSKKPTEGYLDYLMEQNRVEIRKVGGRRGLKQKRPDGETDYLQEYAIHDRQAPGKPLWYAHFHYVKADSAFDVFGKAHLKIPEQQYLGLHWQIDAEKGGVRFADLKIWRGNIGKPLADKHFKDVN
ncbi:dermonecrotic toxin domain-containing protein [Pseudomonas sp. 1152_12]|uniref:dermonecrotic toxin domain-containing protein n=1 Tax=Pseudomonas sp. 1152_12 TaxID=2604455 RepID=UPI004063C45C